MAKILSCQQINTENWYARARPVFEVSGEKYKWLNETVFVGELLPPTSPDFVSIDVYEVL